MYPEPALRAALATVAVIPFAGSFHRVTDLRYRLDSLRARGRLGALDAIGSRILGGRFNGKGRFEVLYLGCDALTAQMEAHAILGRRGSPTLHVGVDGRLTRVLDLTSEEIQRALGTTSEELTAGWRLTQARGREAPTQLLGRLAWASGRIEALYCVSAAHRPDGRCLAVFPDRIAAPSELTVADDHGLLEPERLPRAPASARRRSSRATRRGHP
jgi:RES domain-containing protein